MTDTMTREERIKYCQCCIKRRNSSSSGLICSLTGAQATFEGGCDKFEEDPIAMKEHFYVQEEKKNSRYASIESIIVGLAICCFVIPYTVSVVGVALDCDYSLFVKMIGVTGSFAVLGGLMVYLLYLSRKLRKKAVANEVPDTEMFRIIQEEGYFPHKENDGDITLNVKGMVFALENAPTALCTEGSITEWILMTSGWQCRLHNIQKSPLWPSKCLLFPTRRLYYSLLNHYAMIRRVSEPSFIEPYQSSPNRPQDTMPN